jgi:hypothetical protein
VVLPAGFEPEELDATLGDEPVETSAEKRDGRAVITFQRKVTARPDKDLSVVVSGTVSRQGRGGV